MAIFTGLIELPDRAYPGTSATITVTVKDTGAPATLSGVNGNTVTADATGQFQFETSAGQYKLRIQVGSNVQEELIEIEGSGPGVGEGVLGSSSGLKFRIRNDIAVGTLVSHGFV